MPTLHVSTVNPQSTKHNIVKCVRQTRKQVVSHNVRSLLSHVLGAVDKTSSSFSAHGKIGNFIIIIIIINCAKFVKFDRFCSHNNEHNVCKQTASTPYRGLPLDSTGELLFPDPVGSIAPQRKFLGPSLTGKRVKCCTTD